MKETNMDISCQTSMMEWLDIKKYGSFKNIRSYTEAYLYLPT